MTVSFSSVLEATGGTTTGVPVPDTQVEALGGGRKPKVVATVNGYTWRASVAAMGGQFWLGVSAEHRDKAGLKAGDPVDVTLALDTEERTVAVPDDLAAALATTGARAALDALSYSLRRKHVLDVDGAKTAETRARRIAKVVETLTPR